MTTRFTGFSYESNKDPFCNGDFTVTGISRDDAMRILGELVALENGGKGNADPLVDATRPGGTPPTDLHRQLEDTVAPHETVTHAAQAAPVIVDVGDEPLGLPPQDVPVTIKTAPTPDVGDPEVAAEPEDPAPAKTRPAGKRAGKKGAKKATKKSPPLRAGELPNIKVTTEPELDDVDDVVKAVADDATHAQRWNGVAVYQGQTIRSVAVRGDYTVVLELQNGESVHLDRDDNEIKRSAPVAPEPEPVRPIMTESEKPKSEPPATVEAAAATHNLDDVPAEVMKSPRFKDVVMYALGVCGRGIDHLPQTTELVAAIIAANANVQRRAEVPQRTIRIMHQIGALSQLESDNALAEADAEAGL